MIDNPENGHNPEMRGTEGDPAADVRTPTAVTNPGAQATEPSPRSAGTHPQTLTPANGPAVETEFSSELVRFRQGFEQVQAEFIGEPRAAVEKAETLINGLMNALHDQLQHIHGKVKTETDTEHLRVAMLSYRELFESLGGRRAA
jgi:hypothetical protein